MIDLSNFSSIFLHKGFVDFRKSIDGLSVIVEGNMQLNVFGKYLFVFTNRRKNKVKILYWDKTGFVLWYKRLEKGQFKWPVKMEDDTVELTPQNLKWLLAGVDITKIRPHKELFFEKYH